MTDDPQTATPVDAPETAEYVLPEDADWEDERWDGEPATPVAPPRPRRKLVTPASIALAGVVVAGVGFIAGVQVQKSSGDDGAGGGGLGGPAAMAAMRGAGGAPGGAAGGAPAAAAGAGAARSGGTGGSGAASGSGSGATAGGGSGPAAGAGSGTTAGAAGDGATVGEVVNVKGSTLYVSGTDGTTIEVRVGRRATVQRLAKTTAKQVRPGDSVVVQGTTRSDGGITATAVQAMANGLSLNLGGFGGGLGTGRSGANGSGSSGSGSSDVDQLFGGG